MSTPGEAVPLGTPDDIGGPIKMVPKKASDSVDVKSGERTLPMGLLPFYLVQRPAPQSQPSNERTYGDRRRAMLRAARSSRGRGY